MEARLNDVEPTSGEVLARVIHLHKLHFAQLSAVLGHLACLKRREQRGTER